MHGPRSSHWRVKAALSSSWGMTNSSYRRRLEWDGNGGESPQLHCGQLHDISWWKTIMAASRLYIHTGIRESDNLSGRKMFVTDKHARMLEMFCAGNRKKTVNRHGQLSDVMYHVKIRHSIKESSRVSFRLRSYVNNTLNVRSLFQSGYSSPDAQWHISWCL